MSLCVRPVKARAAGFPPLTWLPSMITEGFGGSDTQNPP